MTKLDSRNDPFFDMRYVYKEYRPEYKLIAKNEILNIRKFFPKETIEHFGSTAIPGVGGKGIIDIYVAVDKKLIEKSRIKIEQLGYEFKLSGGVANERWFYQKDKWINQKRQRFHLHLTYLGNENIGQCLAFRDYLRLHPDDAQKYSKIKIKAIKAAKKFDKKTDKKQAYRLAKEPLILEILNKIKHE